ncbi:MAG: hypothetical protein ABI432_14225 [Flavobacteriales bacterium]
MFTAGLSHASRSVIIICGLSSLVAHAQSFTQQYGGRLSQDGVGIALRGGQYLIATTVFDSTTVQHRGKLLITGSDGQQVSWNELPIAGAVFLHAAEPSSDGGVFLAGSVIVPGGSTHDGLLVKLDATGALQWVAQPERTGDEQYFDIASLPDGGAVVCGVENTGAGHDAWTCRFNADGGTLWNTSAGGPLDEEANAVAVNADGAMLTGRQMNFGGTSDAWFAWIDLGGVVQMTTSWGGPGTEAGRALIPVGADHFVMAGVTDSYGMFDTTEHRIKDNVWLIAINTNGDTLWTRSVGDTLFDHGAWCLDRAGNGDLLLGGERYSQGLSDALVQRVDTSGALIWERGIDTGKEEKLLGLRALPDGVVATGWSFTELSRQVLLLRRNALGD